MKKTIACLLAAACALAGLCGCAKNETAVIEGDSSIDFGQAREPYSFDQFPVLDGSTATLPLGRALAQYYTGMSADEAELKITFSKTDNAYYNIMYGGADLLLVYEGSEAVQQSLKEGGLELEKKVIGYDALVFLTHIENPVSGLTAEQIQGIYTGNITNWNQVGGPDQPIAAYQRNEDSGSQTLMRNLVMAGIPMAEAPTEMRPGGMGFLLEAVAEYNNESGAIGYSVYYYVSNMYSIPDIRLLAVDGVSPSNESIADGRYAFVNPFYAVIRADEPEDSAARQLYDFLSAEEGRQLIETAGYVGVR